jgi:SAM-dependent methyltransferase
MKCTNRLNFGCGKDIREGYVNMDHFALPGVDVVHDFEVFPYPFTDNQFDEIYCSHVLEHTSDLVRVMEEFGRIGKTGCLIRVLVPYFSSPYNALDPTHKRQFNLNTFDHFVSGYISKTNVEILRRKIIFFTCRSFMKSRWYSWPIDVLINLAPKIYQRFFSYVLPAAEIHYLLKLK